MIILVHLNTEINIGSVVRRNRKKYIVPGKRGDTNRIGMQYTTQGKSIAHNVHDVLVNAIIDSLNN